MIALARWLRLHGFRLRLLAALLLVLLLTIGLVIRIGLDIVDRGTENRVRNEARQLAPLLGAVVSIPLAQRDYATLGQLLRDIVADRDIDYLVLRDARGRIVAAANWDEASPLPEPRPSFDLARDARYDIVAPVALGGQQIGMLHFALSLADARLRREELIGKVLAAGAFGLALSVILSVFLAFGMTQRLARLVEASGQLAEGKLATRIGDSRRDEVGQALDAMARKLQDSIQELRDGEERLGRVIQGTSDGFWDWDLNANRIFLSPRFQEMLGYDEDAEFHDRFAFKTWLHEDDREQAVAALQRAVREGAPFDATYRMRCRDAGYRWFRGRGQATRDTSGRIVRFSGTLSDIHTQRLAEREVRDLLAEQQAVLDNALVGIWLVRNRQIVSCNRRCEELFGYQPDELVGRSVRVIYPSDAAFEERGARIYAVLSRGENCLEDMALVRKDGSRFWCATSGRALDPAAPQAGSIWVFSDITEQRRIMAALQEEKDLSDALLAGLPGGFSLYDAEMRMLRWNRRFEFVSGYPPQVLTNALVSDFFAEPDQVRQASRIALERNVVTQGEATLKTADGRLVPHLLYAAPILRGERKLLVGLAIDISDRKQAEAAIRALNETLGTARGRAHCGAGRGQQGTGIFQLLRLSRPHRSAACHRRLLAHG